MQRLVCAKFASKFSSRSSFLHPNHYKIFSSLTEPAQNQLVGSPLTHPFKLLANNSWSSYHSLSGKLHGLLSNPALLNQFLLNSSSTLLKAPSKSLVDCKFLFRRPQFHYRAFNFGSNFGSQRRGWNSWFQGLYANDMVLGLVLANAAVFMLWRIADQRFMVNNFMISLDNFKSGRLHTLITSAFSHTDMGHLVSNMIGLYFFGSSISRNFGPDYLLKLYLAGALGGSIFFLVHHAIMSLSSKGGGLFRMDPSRTPGLGASGAVNAIMLPEIFLNPRATLYFDFFIPVPAMLLGIFLVGKDMLRILEGDSNISGSAHLGGATVAALAWFRLRRGRF